MTDEQVEKIARRVADVGNSYAEYEEGISHEMAMAIAREIAPLILASMKCRDAAASCCRIIAKHGLVDEIEMEYRGFGADVDAALKSWLGWGEGEKSDQRIKV